MKEDQQIGSDSKQYCNSLISPADMKCTFDWYPMYLLSSEINSMNQTIDKKEMINEDLLNGSVSLSNISVIKKPLKTKRTELETIIENCRNMNRNSYKIY